MVNDLFSIVDAGTQVVGFAGKRHRTNRQSVQGFELFAEQVIEFKIAKLA